MSKIIGYRMSVHFRFLGNLDLFNAHTLFSKYYLNYSEIERGKNKLWRLEKIPMIQVSACCIRDIDEKDYPKDVYKVMELRYNRNRK